MIIPIRCMTCGKVLANKWNYYVEHTKNEEEHNIINTNVKNVKKTKKGEVMDKLGLKRYCCRRHILTHCDLVEII
jgi:DNA-directed RNA polymerases I, II, and III subunit RPABC5